MGGGGGGGGGGGEAMLRQVEQLLFAELLLATRQCSSNTHSGKVPSWRLTAYLTITVRPFTMPCEHAHPYKLRMR